MLKKPKFKICKRLGPGVYDKCQTPKFSASASSVSKKRTKPLSEYGLQLVEKQKVRFSYGITEKQLSNYVQKASLIKGEKTSDKLYDLLETRLDNIVYRMGIAPSRRSARQMVSHGHFIVNGKKVTVPSFSLKTGDSVGIREGSKSKKVFSGLEQKMKDYTVPVWLNFNPEKLDGKILDKPKNDNLFFDLNAVLEFYSR